MLVLKLHKRKQTFIIRLPSRTRFAGSGCFKILNVLANPITRSM